MRGLFKNQHPIMQLGIFLLIGGICYTAAQLFALVLVAFNSDVSDLDSIQGSLEAMLDNVNMAIWMQIVSALLMFIVSSVVTLYLITGKKKEDLYLDESASDKDDNPFLQLKKLSIVNLALSIAIIFLAGIFANLSIMLMESIELPESLSAISSLIEKMDAMQANLMDKFLNVESIGSIIAIFFMMTVIPAVGEELFFRGLGQRLLGKLLSNHHAAVWIAAVAFGAIHFQFTNFIAITLLGAVLGYAYYYTKNLWVPIAMHFFNNFLAITVSMLYNKGIITIDLSRIDFIPWYVSVIAGIAVLGLFCVLHNRNKKTEEVAARLG